MRVKQFVTRLMRRAASRLAETSSTHPILLFKTAAAASYNVHFIGSFIAAPMNLGLFYQTIEILYFLSIFTSH